MRHLSLAPELRYLLRCFATAALVLALTLVPLRTLTEPADEAIPTALGAFSGQLETELLSRVLAAEVGEKSYAAQVALGAVLCNRLADPRYPASLGDVIAEAGLRLSDGDIPARSRRAAEVALRGVDPTHGATNWGEVSEPLITLDGVVFGR